MHKNTCLYLYLNFFSNPAAWNIYIFILNKLDEFLLEEKELQFWCVKHILDNYNHYQTDWQVTSSVATNGRREMYTAPPDLFIVCTLLSEWYLTIFYFSSYIILTYCKNHFFKVHLFLYESIQTCIFYLFIFKLKWNHVVESLNLDNFFNFLDKVFKIGLNR